MTRTVAAAVPGMPVLSPDPSGNSRALAAVVAAASRPAPEHPDGDLLSFAATVDRLQSEVEPMLGNPDPHLDAAYEAKANAQSEAMKMMAGFRAITLASLAAQVRALRYIHGEEFTENTLELVGGGTDCQLAWAVLSSLAWGRPPIAAGKAHPRPRSLTNTTPNCSTSAGAGPSCSKTGGSPTTTTRTLRPSSATSATTPCSTAKRG